MENYDRKLRMEANVRKKKNVEKTTEFVQNIREDRSVIATTKHNVQ